MSAVAGFTVREHCVTNRGAREGTDESGGDDLQKRSTATATAFGRDDLGADAVLADVFELNCESTVLVAILRAYDLGL